MNTFFKSSKYVTRDVVHGTQYLYRVTYKEFDRIEVANVWAYPSFDAGRKYDDHGVILDRLMTRLVDYGLEYEAENLDVQKIERVKATV